jgi:hypothetical protein
LGFLLKLIVFTLAFAFVVYVFKMIARLAHNVRATITDVNKLKEAMRTAGQTVGRQTRPAVSAEMVRCLQCGSFVSAKESVTVSVRQRKQIFCSRECMQRHAVS